MIIKREGERDDVDDLILNYSCHILRVIVECERLQRFKVFATIINGSAFDSLHLCLYECTCACMSECTMSVCMCTLTYMCKCMCLYACVYVCVSYENTN